MAERVYESFEPSMEWVRDPDAETLVVHLPGFTKEQLKVQVASLSNLRIGGERHIGDNKWSRFSKQIPLASNYETGGVTAKFENGILYVKQRKVAKAAPPPPQPPTQTPGPQIQRPPQQPPAEAPRTQKPPQEIPQETPQEEVQQPPAEAPRTQKPPLEIPQETPQEEVQQPPAEAPRTQKPPQEIPQETPQEEVQQPPAEAPRTQKPPQEIPQETPQEEVQQPPAEAPRTQKPPQEIPQETPQEEVQQPPAEAPRTQKPPQEIPQETPPEEVQQPPAEAPKAQESPQEKAPKPEETAPLEPEPQAEAPTPAKLPEDLVKPPAETPRTGSPADGLRKASVDRQQGGKTDHDAATGKANSISQPTETPLEKEKDSKEQDVEEKSNGQPAEAAGKVVNGSTSATTAEHENHGKSLEDSADMGGDEAAIERGAGDKPRNMVNLILVCLSAAILGTYAMNAIRFITNSDGKN